MLAVEHSALALAIVLSGAILLLLLGTQILDWPWLVLLAVSGAVLTGLRVRQNLLSRYRVAQLVDRRLVFSDALSTAWFLLDHPHQPNHNFTRAQIELAEKTAEKVDPAIVFPFEWKRRVWGLAAALAAVAFGLFAVRYLVTNSLSLKQALIPLPGLIPAEVLERSENPSKRDRTPKPIRARIGNSPLPGTNGPREEKKPDEAQKDATETAGNSASDNAGKIAQQTTGSQRKPDGSGNSANQSKSELSNGSDKEGSPNGKTEKSEAKAGHSPDKDSRTDGNQQPSSSLASKMKDAFSGLMEKMRPQESSAKDSSQERSQQQSKAGDQSSSNSARNGQVQQNAKDSQEKQGEGREQSAQPQSEAQASEKSPGKQGHASDESANRKGSDAQSGIGRQDGEKTLREAEQLRAMGKLDEIIGKRSAGLTGDMTIETRSSHQQLQTQYSGRVGHHADLGGEIDRNQVPIALQKYVREYMQEVHKQADKEQ